MTLSGLGNVDILGVLKYGAIGISLACLIFAFWTNQTLADRATKLPQQKLDHLLRHARWTMTFSFMCLIAASLIEAVDHFYAPVTLHIGIVPSNLDSDAKRLRYLKQLDALVRLQVGASNEDVKLKNGGGLIKVGPNETILVYVDGMWGAVKDLDDIAYADQQRTVGVAQTLEPKQ